MRWIKQSNEWKFWNINNQKKKVQMNEKWMNEYEWTERNNMKMNNGYLINN